MYNQSMSLTFKKIDNGQSWTYRARFKQWQLLLIVFIPIFIGYFVPVLNSNVRVIAVLFGIGFAFVYGMSSLPMTWSFRQAARKGRQIVAKKKDGFYQYTIPK